MTPREMAAVLRRPFGSVLPEPSQDQVYEERLPRLAVAGENLLDRTVGRSKGRLVPAEIDLRKADPAQTAWAPWCSNCRLEPEGGSWTLEAAEYLARVHDAEHHFAAWTAEARPATEVARLAAGGAR